MKRLILLAMTTLILTGCGTNDDSKIIEKNETAASKSAITETTASVIQQDVSQPIEDSAEIILKTENVEILENEESEKENESKLQIEVNGYTLIAALADNSSAQAFAEIIKDEPMILELNEYGSFEKVGALPQSILTNDESITTEPGDIMLYQGNQITIFYGTNSWSYTKLGRIDNTSPEELKKILGENGVTVTFSLTK